MIRVNVMTEPLRQVLRGRRYKERNRTALRDQQREYRRSGAYLVPLYGLTAEKHTQIESEQGGRCAICGAEPSCSRRLCVDHDHNTGKVRGLLCDSCNIGLGKFKDSRELLDAANDYLSLHVDGHLV